MGNFKKDDLTLDFHGMRTEDISSTIPYMQKLNADAKMLASQINQPLVNRKTMVLFNESENYDMYKLFEKSPNLNNNDNNFSETSAFISSQDYASLFKQKGGSKHKVVDESSTSSDSSDSDDNTIISSIKKSAKKSEFKETDSDLNPAFKKDKKKKSLRLDSDEFDNTDEPSDEDDNDMDFIESDMSTGSYLSSSAHTDGIDSESEYNTTVSVRHQGSRHVMSDSINTSDINIVSLEDD